MIGLLLVTFHDRQHKGSRAYKHYLDDNDNIYLNNCGKVVYGPSWISSYQTSHKETKAIISKGRQTTVVSLWTVMVSTYFV